MVAEGHHYTRASEWGRGEGDAPGDLKGQRRRRAKVLRSRHARISPSSHVRANEVGNSGIKRATKNAPLARERHSASRVRVTTHVHITYSCAIPATSRGESVNMRKGALRL